MHPIRTGRRAVTFVELLMVVAVVAVGVFFTCQQVGGQSSFFYLRGDLNAVVAALLRASVLSSSRGELSDATGGNVLSGVTFYQGRFSGGAPSPDGQSMAPWFANDPLSPLANPQVAVPAMDGDARTALHNLHLETILTRRYTPAAVPVAPPPLTDLAYFQYRKGTLDVFDAGGDQIAAGYRSQLKAWFFEEPSSRSATTGVAYTFDVVNLNAGWARVRVFIGGGVQVSGIVDLAAPISTRAGGLF